MHMSRALHHTIIPAAIPVIFFAVANTPVDWFGRRNRGLIAVTRSLHSNNRIIGRRCILAAIMRP